jgi:membrane fusion protein (multidrug efflux system)
MGSRPRTPALASALLAVAVAVASALGGASCGPQRRAGFAMPPIPVEVRDVSPVNMRSQFRATGGVEAEETVEIVSEIAGTLAELPFREGGPIAAGALLARLDDRESSAELARAEAQLELSRSNARRAETLHQEQLISQAQLDDARTGLKVAEANAALAAARLDKTRVRAPFSGVVGRRRVSPGAYVRAGDAITEIARIDRMKVRFSAPERYAATLRPGHRIELGVPALPGELFQGEIAVVDPILDPETRTVQIVARVVNRGLRLRPGMSGNVGVTLTERAQALVVSDEALFAEGSQNLVYVVKPDSTVERTVVTLGIRDSSLVEIVTGLAPGARVVAAGHQKLFPGAKVMPIPEGAMGMPGAGAAARGAPGGGRPGAGAGKDSGAAAGGRAAAAGAGR